MVVYCSDAGMPGIRSRLASRSCRAGCRRARRGASGPQPPLRPPTWRAVSIVPILLRRVLPAASERAEALNSPNPSMRRSCSTKARRGSPQRLPPSRRCIRIARWRCRELTKPHEEVVRDRAGRWLPCSPSAIVQVRSKAKSSWSAIRPNKRVRPRCAAGGPNARRAQSRRRAF